MPQGEKERICLRCAKQFISKGPQNRICPHCVKATPKVYDQTVGSLPHRRGGNNGQI